MLEFFNELWSPGIFIAQGHSYLKPSFMPHGMCYLWKPGLVWLHLISDSTIALAYYSIPITLLYFALKRCDLPFKWMFWLFAAFIISCGTSHLMAVWTLWHPTYWLSGAIKAITAIVSSIAAVSLVPLIPQALALPSPEQLQAANQELQNQIVERQKVEAALRESEKRALALLNATSDTAMLIEPSGNILSVNEIGAQRLGTSIVGAVGRCFYDFLPLEVGQVRKARIDEVIGSGQPLRFEDEHEGMYFQNSVCPVLNGHGKATSLAVFARDITEQKRAEAEIRSSLEKERELSEFKSRIVSVVSHEYRTPLTAILSSVELLERYSHKWSEEKKLHHLHRIKISVQHLTNLVGDVLIVSQAEAEKLSFIPTHLDLVSFCQELLTEFQLIAKEGQTISFVSRGNCSGAYLDEKLVRQILTNLISNALKYSPQGGTVHFELICDQNHVRFRIQDEGSGIPLADQQRLFESFYRASNVGTIPGTGLGLVIVKKCVDLQGGEIAVESEVGVGSTFTVTLPLNQG
jgi:PAS domain S-box-containing protein